MLQKFLRFQFTRYLSLKLCILLFKIGHFFLQLADFLHEGLILFFGQRNALRKNNGAPVFVNKPFDFSEDIHSDISLPNVLDETDTCLARQVRSSWRDKHVSCLWRLVGLRGLHVFSMALAFGYTYKAQ